MSRLAAAARRRGWVRPMHGRDVDEAHRASTPLELLFDLSFVVAVSQAAASLRHGLADGGGGLVVLAYAMAFFAIWWAWMNFTWFASAFDVDDVPYRLLTLVQVVGVLVLATGVGDVFAHDPDFTVVTVGYVVIRAAMMPQWLRAAASNPDSRREGRRYAAAIVVVQALWLLRLLLPATLGWGVASFAVLALAELAVPLWAEWSPTRGAATSWHAEHIAERYGLFTLIVLGECILAVTAAIHSTLGEHGLSPHLLAIAAGGIAIVFALWWTYFRAEAAELLRATPASSFVWGYGHYFVFAAAAALGAGLELAVEHAEGVTELSRVGTGLAVAVPVAVFLAVVGEFQANPHTGAAPLRWWYWAAAAVVLALGASAGQLGVAGTTAAIGVATVAVTIATGLRAATDRHD